MTHPESKINLLSFSTRGLLSDGGKHHLNLHTSGCTAAKAKQMIDVISATRNSKFATSCAAPAMKGFDKDGTICTCTRDYESES